MSSEAQSRSVLRKLESHLHALIRERVGDLVNDGGVELPKLVTPLPSESEAEWFPVPGMHGGFRYWAAGTPDAPRLVCESWSRVEAGSGQRHEITEAGSMLVDEGFV